MKQVSWGMIGCGKVTEVKSGPAFNKIADSRLVAVMRRDRKKAEDYARRHGVQKWSDDADEVINDADVNAIYIATPPDSHAEYTLKAAAAGKPIYVEKPMARTFRECTRMIEACSAANVPLFVAYYRRLLPGFVKVKEWLDGGAIGQVRMVQIVLHTPPRQDDFRSDNLPWRVQPEMAGGGYFYDLASHQLDYLDYVFGPITSVSGIAANQAGLYPAEDVVSASFMFESGIVGSGSWCFTVLAENHRDEIDITGSRGRIRFSTFGHDTISLESDTGAEEFEPSKPEHVQQPLIQTVVGDLLGRGICPSTGETAARTNRVMETIIKGGFS